MSPASATAHSSPQTATAPVPAAGADGAVQPIPPFIIGVCGGTASGKSTVCEILVKNLSVFGDIKIIHQGNFYKDVDDSIDVANYNFEHPGALDYDLMIETLVNLRQCKETRIPVYDLATSKRLSETEAIKPFRVILLEGTLLMYSKPLRDLMDLAVFVDCDSDTRLCRRVTRDIEVYGYSLDEILYQYLHFIKPAFEDFVLPSKKHADIIVPRGAENTVAVELIAEHIREVLSLKAEANFIDLKHVYVASRYLGI